MEENNVFLRIKSNLLEEKSVTYTQLLNNLDVSPNESQIFLKMFKDQNKEFGATYLNYSSEDNINHTLTLSDCSSNNDVVISLKYNESDVLDFKNFHITQMHLEEKNPPIISDEIYLLPRTRSREIETKSSDELKKPVNSNLQINNNPTTTISDKRLEFFEKSKNSTSSKETKPKVSSCKDQPRKEPPVKIEIKNEFDSDFELSDFDIVHATQTPKNLKSKSAAIKSEKKLEVITFNALTKSDIICKTSLKKDKSKNSVARSRLFENFENESPKRSLSKRRRLVIESDEDENDENVLVNESFEENKSSSTLKSHPSKRFKSKDTPKLIESEEVPMKKQMIDSFCKSGFKKVEKTYQDEDGFLVVEKVLVPLNCEENRNQTRENIELIPSTQPAKIEKKIGKKSKQVESKGKQTNIMNFFQKNN